MDSPAARSLMETVRQINEMGRRARAGGEPGVEAYLRIVASDPTTEWFTELLREKSQELATERERADPSWRAHLEPGPRSQRYLREASRRSGLCN